MDDNIAGYLKGQILQFWAVGLVVVIIASLIGGWIDRRLFW